MYNIFFRKMYNISENFKIFTECTKKHLKLSKNAR